MKKCIAMGMLILCLIFPFAAFGEMGLQLFPLEGYEEATIKSLAVVDDTLYILTWDGMFSWRPGDMGASFLSADEGLGFVWDSARMDMKAMDDYIYQGEIAVNMIFPSEEGLVGLRKPSGELVSIFQEDETWKVETIVQLDWDSMGLEDSPYEEQRRVSQGVILGQTLYLPIQKSSANRNLFELVAFDMKSGAKETIAIENLMGIFPFDDDRLLCMQGNTGMTDSLATGDLVVFDPSTGRTEPYMTSLPFGAAGICYDPKSEGVYMQAGGEVLLKKPNGEKTVAAYMPEGRAIFGSMAVLLSDRYYVAEIDLDSVIVRDVTIDLANVRALRIGVPRSNYKVEEAKGFQLVNPGVPIVLTNYNDGVTDAITLHMITQDDSIDIYIVDASSSVFTEMKKKGYAVDLAANETANIFVQRIHDNIRSSLYEEGRLLAFPQIFYIYGLGYAPALFADIGAKVPETQLEYLDFITWWVEEHGYSSTGASLQNNYRAFRRTTGIRLINEYLLYYEAVGEPLTFDTPLFRRLLDKFEDTSPALLELERQASAGPQMRYVNEEIEAGGRYLFEEHLEFCPIEEGPLYKDIYRSLLLPVDEGMEPVIAGNMYVYVVNPYSKNIDIVMEYITYCVENMTRAMSISLCPDDTAPVIATYYDEQIAFYQNKNEEYYEMLETAEPEDSRWIKEYIAMNDEWINAYIDESTLYSREYIAEYHQMLDYVQLRGDAHAFFYGAMEGWGIQEQYFEGQLTAEQFIAELERKLAMWRMESGTDR